MREIYQETKELLDQKGIDCKQCLSTSALGWWWALWIIKNLISQRVFHYAFYAESIDDLTTGTVASMIGNIIGLPLALITVKVIRDYSTVEPLLLEIKDEEETTTA